MEYLLLLAVLCLWPVLAVVVAVGARNRGRSGFGFLILALVLSPVVALLVLVALGPARRNPTEAEVCPFCGNLAPASATLCATCGRDIPIAAHRKMWRWVIAEDKALASPERQADLMAALAKRNAENDKFYAQYDRTRNRVIIGAFAVGVIIVVFSLP